MRKPSYQLCAVISLILVGGFAATDSPYYRTGPGPLISVGGGPPGTWSVTTVRVRRSTWFRWAVDKVRGGHAYRDDRSGESGGTTGDDAMNAAQTHAVLVAAQVAARRAPTGAAGLQVTQAESAVARPGDILLAAGKGGRLSPLRTPGDLALASVQGASHLLVVPRAADGSWARAEVRRVPYGALADVHADPVVSAVAYRLRPVQGPSAGLVLALARIDDLTPGDLSGGRRMTGTGAISLDGRATSVAGIAEKVRAADSAHADVFFVPYVQRAAALDAARGTDVRIVAVRSVSDAVGWLCAGAPGMLGRPQAPAKAAGESPGCW